MFLPSTDPKSAQLVQCSGYAEHTRLLTPDPHSWDRAQVEAFFNCSEHQGRYGVHLADYGRMLHLLADLRAYFAVDPKIEQKIFKFYHDNLISRVTLKPPTVVFPYCIGLARSHRIQMTF